MIVQPIKTVRLTAGAMTIAELLDAHLQAVPERSIIVMTSKVVSLGEGTERTPICLIEDVPFVQFQDRSPTEVELDNLYIPAEEDIFAPLTEAVPWGPGGKGAKHGR